MDSTLPVTDPIPEPDPGFHTAIPLTELQHSVCLLYTSDAADERSSVDLGGRRIIKKKKTTVLHSGAQRSNIRLRSLYTLCES